VSMQALKNQLCQGLSPQLLCKIVSMICESKPQLSSAVCHSSLCEGNSGKTAPECDLFEASDLTAPWYRSDWNFECGSKKMLTPQKPTPAPPSPGPSPSPPGPPPGPGPTPPPGPPAIAGAVVLAQCDSGNVRQAWTSDFANPQWLVTGAVPHLECLTVTHGSSPPPPTPPPPPPPPSPPTPPTPSPSPTGP
jgi:hypothetical protein